MLSYPYVDEGFKCFFTLKTLKIPKTFSTQNLHIRNFCCTFAPESSTPGGRGWEMSPSRKAKLFDPVPSRGFQDIFKRRLLRSVLTVRNLANFKNNQDLVTVDVLRDIDYPSCAYLVCLLRINLVRMRVP